VVVAEDIEGEALATLVVNNILVALGDACGSCARFKGAGACFPPAGNVWHTVLVSNAAGRLRCAWYELHCN
jgi:hypothetical protein